MDERCKLILKYLEYHERDGSDSVRLSHHDIEHVRYCDDNGYCDVKSISNQGKEYRAITRQLFKIEYKMTDLGIKTANLLRL